MLTVSDEVPPRIMIDSISESSSAVGGTNFCSLSFFILLYILDYKIARWPFMLLLSTMFF